MSRAAAQLYNSTQAVRERLRNGPTLPDGLEPLLSRLASDALVAVAVMTVQEDQLHGHRDHQGQPEQGEESSSLPGQLGIDLRETKGGEA